MGAVNGSLQICFNRLACLTPDQTSAVKGAITFILPEDAYSSLIYRISSAP